MRGSWQGPAILPQQRGGCQLLGHDHECRGVREHVWAQRATEQVSLLLWVLLLSRGRG